MALALVGGCTSGEDGAAPAAETPADPKEQLVAGIKALNSATFRVAGSSTLNSVSTSSAGVADPGRRAMRLTQSVSAAGKITATDVVALGTDIYLRFEVPAIPGLAAGKWAHVDGRRLKSLQAMGVGGPDDLSGRLAMVSAITSIERTGPGEVRGTFDLSKGGGLLPGASGALGDGLKNAQWQARFGPQGQLTWVSVTVPASGGIPAVTTDTTYSGFGEPVVVERPSARDVVEAPENVYTFLGR